MINWNLNQNSDILIQEKMYDSIMFHVCWRLIRRYLDDVRLDKPQTGPAFYRRMST